MALVIASCTAHSRPGPAAVAGPGAGLLQITQVRVGNAIPVEGSLSYIRVARAGVTITSRQLLHDQKLTIRLKPGSYRLQSWQRLCEGNCANLDPPSARCARSFTVGQDQHITATIRIDVVAGCLIVLQP